MSTCNHKTTRYSIRVNFAEWDNSAQHIAPFSRLVGGLTSVRVKVLLWGNTLSVEHRSRGLTSHEPGPLWQAVGHGRTWDAGAAASRTEHVERGKPVHRMGGRA